MRFVATKATELLFWNRRYASLREPKARGPVPHDPSVHARLADELQALGYRTEPWRIDIDGYRAYLERAQYERYSTYYAGGRAPGFHEKGLEHYLTAELLALGSDDVYVDVASYDSPAPDIYRRVYRCRSYRQDLVYPPGVHGERIGGDAASMPVPAEFATAIGLHNAFEHFEADADSRFVVEAGRVLRPGGRMCIVPLFLHEHYAIQTDPAVHPPGGMSFEGDAVLYAERGWRNRHGRFYDPEHLERRIGQKLGPLRLRILVLENPEAVHPDCYARFVALFDRN